MNASDIFKSINLKLKNYADHKSKVIEERVYWTCVDKIFEAQNYEDYELDSNNNIYVSYSLKKEESIINQPHDSITAQIISEYRKNLKKRLVKDGFFVKYSEDEVKIYFSEPSITFDFNDLEEDIDTNEDLDTNDETNQNITIFEK